MHRVQEILPEIRQAAHQTVARYGHRLHLQDMDTDDLYHDLVVALIENNCERMRKFDPQKASLCTWLGVIARNIIKNGARKKSFAFIQIDRIQEPYLIAFQETELILSERDALLSSALKQLSPEGWGQLRRFYEIPAPELARRLGISQAAVRQRKCRLERKLRSLLHLD